MNELKIKGIEFIEFASPDQSALLNIFSDLGFHKKQKHKQKNIFRYQQNNINFLFNSESNSFAKNFSSTHGPSISSLGFRVNDAKNALKIAIHRGASECTDIDYLDNKGKPIPAIYGVGESLIYLIEDAAEEQVYSNLGFVDEAETVTSNNGLILIDHLTNNVHQGDLQRWADFYKNIFGFTEVRYFNIKGNKTGLTSFALRSPCGTFCIPINEATDKKSQINEYLEEYKGPGIQHIAFLTHDILQTMQQLKKSSINFLDIEESYYSTVFDRVPYVSEDKKRIQDLGLLIDGDRAGYLLQIFTKNLLGPIFIEIIQRKNHNSFGEGNFGALFRSIERDQEKRGYLK